MGTVVIGQMPHAWDPFAHKYKCCCSCCHVKTGAMIIGILEAINYFGSVGGSAYNNANLADFTSGSDSSVIRSIGAASLGLSIATLVIGGVILGCFFYGLYAEKANWLIPHLVLQIIGIVICGIAIIGAIILTAVGQTVIHQLIEAAQNGGGTIDPDVAAATDALVIVVGVMFIVTFIIYEIIYVWLFLVVRNCYRYFKDKDAHAGQAQLSYTQQQPGYQPAYGQQSYGQQPQQQAYPQKY